MGMTTRLVLLNKRGRNGCGRDGKDVVVVVVVVVGSVVGSVLGSTQNESIIIHIRLVIQL